MPDNISQPADIPKRPRTARSPRRTSRKQAGKATTSAMPEQEASAPLVPNTVENTALPLPPAPEASAKLAPNASPIGERWGEFPPPERQVELKGMLEAWDQEQDHGDRPGPFAKIRLTGADVYWLTALTAGEGDVDVGKKELDESPHAQITSLRLEGAYLNRAHLEGANLSGAHLEGAVLSGAHLEGAALWGAWMEGTDLRTAHLEGADMSGTHLEGADLYRAHLEGTALRAAHLEGIHLERAHLEGANLYTAILTCHVNLRGATFDVKTQLAQVSLDATLQVANVLWNGVPLIGVEWEQVSHLDDETKARQAHRSDGMKKDIRERKEEYRDATRAYRQLAIALRGQGITEAADRFTYRALIMQRKALWWQMRSIPLLTKPAKKEGTAEQSPQQAPSPSLLRSAKQFLNWSAGVLEMGRLLGPYIFSWFLAVLTGYGFRMSRIVVAYLLLICGFAGEYWSVGVHQPRDISFWTALIVSVTAFHGRVFTNPFAPNIPDAQVVITAIEAIVGLVIEGVFIAMLTQRFFNR